MTVPAVVVGGGSGLADRNRGWMCDSSSSVGVTCGDIGAVMNRSICGREPLSFATYGPGITDPAGLKLGRPSGVDPALYCAGNGPSSARAGEFARLPGMVSNLVLIGVVGRSREEYALASEIDRLLIVDCVAVESLRAQVVKVAALIEACPARLLEEGLSGPVLVEGVQE